MGKLRLRGSQRRLTHYCASCRRGSSPEQGQSLQARHLCYVTVALLLILQGLATSQIKPIRRVLIFHEVGPSYPAVGVFDEGFKSGIANSRYQLEFYTEFLDAILFPDSKDQRRFRDFYIRKYEHRQPDVIITFGPSPLKFMEEAH